MSKKVLNTKSVMNELKGQSVFFRKEPSPQSKRTGSESVTEVLDEGKIPQKPMDKKTKKVTQKPAQTSAISRKVSRDNSREIPRVEPRNFPTRDEIQEFSFRLRDELKVKVQAEVPHLWQKELEEVARQLDVKKLELFRYIFGEFLGKVK